LGNGEKSICDTLKYWYGNEIRHPSHAQKTESNNKVKQSDKAKPNHKQGNQSKSNIHKQLSNQCFERAKKT